MQRSRNWRRREREDVGLQPKLLESLLVLHAEAMLLVDDDEPQVREPHIGTQQSVRADDDVDLLRGEIGEHIGLLLCRLESAQRRDADRKIGKAIAERSLMLVSENRRRDEDSDLPVRLHGL